MGRWKELETEISVELDLSDLDHLLNYGDEFAPLKLKVEQIKSKMERGSKRAVHELAKRNVSWQEKYINKHCKNPSGMLASSIVPEKKTDYSWITGTRINHIYPMSVEYGRKGFGPKKAKALAFYNDDGELIFRKRVGPAMPRPFVSPAYTETLLVSEEMLIREIGHAGMKFE